jgi:hypothetical protein
MAEFRSEIRDGVPRTLRPIFRDRDDFTGGHSLATATIEALNQSAALIVICSPVAANRGRYTQIEICLDLGNPPFL